MCTTMDIAQRITTSRSIGVVAQMTPEQVLCPQRSAEAATFLISLLTLTGDYRSQALEVIYMVASADRADPWAYPWAARVKTFVRFSAVNAVSDGAEDTLADERVHNDLADRLASARDALYADFTLSPTSASAIGWALGAKACVHRVAALRFASRAPDGVSLAPPHIARTLDYLARRPGRAALTFRVERRSTLSTDEASLRFGVVALGEAADDQALALLSAELCGCGTLTVAPGPVATPNLARMRPTTDEQRALLTYYVTAPASELPETLAGLAGDDVTLTDSEAGGRIALPPLLLPVLS